MRLKKKLVQYCHDAYYALVSDRGIEFAMRCKDVTAMIDLGNVPQDFRGRFRFYLHLSLCGLCHFYADATKALRKATRNFINTHERSLNIELLNQNLLKRFSK